jgi:hypothetical protein
MPNEKTMMTGTIRGDLSNGANVANNSSTNAD